MRSDQDEPDDAMSRFDWFRDRLRPPWDCVASSWVPTGFDAYARILHPVRDENGQPLIRWADVSRWSGVALEPSVQWHHVALPAVTPSVEPPWNGHGPRVGSLSRSDTVELVRRLDPWTSGGCSFGVWEGYGSDLTVDGPIFEDVPRRSDEMTVLELQWRSYAMFEGPVMGATCFMTSRFQSPNLWWSEDRSWFIASEIDLPWTYVAGPRRLIDELLADSEIEALESSPDERLDLTLPSWLEDRVRGAVDDVIESGSTSIEFALGTASVTLMPLGRKNSVLVVRSDRRSGWGGTNIPVTGQGDAALRREIKDAVLRAILGLVE